YDPDYLTGWNKRGHNWEAQASVQAELRPGVSAAATYTRHWYANFLVNKNLLVNAPSDYSPFCVTAPVDARLPGGGGNSICGFFDINPNKFGQSDILITKASNYGNITDVYNGFDLTVNMRLPKGMTFQGGSSTGHEVLDICEIAGVVN